MSSFLLYKQSAIIDHWRTMTADDLLAEHAAMLKRMIEEMEQTVGVVAAYPITQNLLAAYEAIRKEMEVRR